VRLRALLDAPSAFGTTHAEAAARDAAWWDERVRTCAAGPDSALFVAERDGTLCGLVGGERSDVPGAVDVISMWVDPAARGARLGTRLLDAVEAWARGAGARMLQLMVTDTNDHAIALYEAYGFVFTGRSDPHPSQPALRELEMRRLIRQARGGAIR
jgi:ribosomal protein S18 acetylase RimI-like enzyme